jgi:Tol biopolymer transport system component
MDPDGSHQIRLTTTSVGEYWPSWSPDGRYIAYVRVSEIDEQDIWIMEAHGSRQEDLGLCPGTADCGKLAWAPGGRRVAYTQGEDLWLADLATGTRKRLAAGMVVTGTPPKGFVGGTRGPGPTWSPDGRSIAFTCGGSLCVVSARGGEPRLVADGQGTDFNDLDWSPTGNWVAFTSSPTDNGPWNIYVQRSDGTGRRQITSYTQNGVFDPTWAPKGKALVYSDWSGENRGELWRIELDGGDPVQLNSGGSHYNPDWWGPGALP